MSLPEVRGPFDARDIAHLNDLLPWNLWRIQGVVEQREGEEAGVAWFERGAFLRPSHPYSERHCHLKEGPQLHITGTVSDDFQLEGVFKRDSSQEEAALSQAADHPA